MITVSKNICFILIGLHHTLNIIVISKMYVATESIYRTYCGVYPFSSEFKAFSLSIGRNKEKRRGKKITCITFFLYVYIFSIYDF